MVHGIVVHPVADYGGQLFTIILAVEVDAAAVVSYAARNCDFTAIRLQVVKMLLEASYEGTHMLGGCVFEGRCYGHCGFHCRGFCCHLCYALARI